MKWTKQQIATVISVAFHIAGFIGIGFLQLPFYLLFIPVNLFLSAALIFFTQEKINAPFILFFLAAIGIGFGAEWLGIHTGLLFGDFTFGTAMGPQWQGVPYTIGIQWFVVLYSSGICMAMLHEKLLQNQLPGSKGVPAFWVWVSMVADGTLLALFFDWVMEPVAMHLGLWAWEGGEVPGLNYATWWGTGALIMVFFQLLPFHRRNLFAVHLLMIQVMFFLLLRFVLL